MRKKGVNYFCAQRRNTSPHKQKMRKFLHIYPPAVGSIHRRGRFFWYVIEEVVPNDYAQLQLCVNFLQVKALTYMANIPVRFHFDQKLPLLRKIALIIALTTLHLGTHFILAQTTVA